MTARKPEKNAKIEAWFSNARRTLEPYAERGESVGQYSIFYTQGQKLLWGEWSNGVPHGRTLTWYPDGSPMHEVSFRDGKFHGNWRKWGKAGELLISARYEQGRLQEWIEWDEASQVYRHFGEHREPGLAGAS